MVCILAFTGMEAQTVPPSLDKRVRVPLKQVNIISLGDMITAQTGFILSFNAQKIIAQKQLLLRQPSYSMHQLLTMIREATGSEYTIYQEHVIFHRTNNKDVITQVTASNQPRKQVTEKRLIATIRQPKTTRAMHKTGILANLTPATTTMASNTDIAKKAVSDSSTLTPLNIITGSSKTISNSPSYSLTAAAPVKLSIPTIKPTTPALQRVTSPAKRQREPYIYEKPGLFKPFVQPGFAADEALYANFQAKAGMTLAYGIVSWSTNFSVSGFRYGAGISYPVNNRWLIELEATTGKLFKETPIHTVSDTGATRPIVYVNSQLQRISLFVQRRIAAHLSVHAGPVFNRLKSTYQLTTWPLSLATLRLIATTPEKDYVTIKPPYTLHRSPPEEMEDISTWIGFQVGISYRF